MENYKVHNISTHKNDLLFAQTIHEKPINCYLFHIFSFPVFISHYNRETFAIIPVT